MVGRRFGVSLLSRVLEVGPDQVAGRLRELHGLDFVFPSAQEPELMYSFKHALTQDVVYAGVLERRRRTYHAAAGRGLEELYTGRIDDVVELIAYHFGRGQVWDKAVTYLRQAAAKAQGRSAHREALASLEEALEALRHLPETPETREQGIDVRLELRGSLYPLGEFEKMLAYLREAEAMASAISDSRRLGLVSIHTAEYFRQTGRFAEARTLAEQALALGDKLQDVPLQLYASHYLGLACHALGDYRRACRGVAGRRAGAGSPNGGAGAFAAWSIGSWDGIIRRSPSPGSRAVSRSSGSSTRASTPAAGRWPSPKGSAAPTAWRRPASGWGTATSSRAISTRRAPCSSGPAASPARRTSRCSVRRPPGSWAASISWPGGSTRALPWCGRLRRRSSRSGS